jgi:FAD/FMN-containing dehydrogenase
MTRTLADELARVAGREHVIADPEVRASYERDVTGRYRGEAALVVRPARDQLPGVVRACAAAGAAVVPQGGNTGLAGGQIPLGGAVVLRLDRLDAEPRIDRAAAQARVEAGVTLADLQRALAGTPYEFAVDHGARSAATLGGMAATNAGGSQVFRHGAMRAQVIGLEAVLADGSVVTRTSGLIKDNVGYDLPGLLVGSEGTLGVITELVLRLIPRRAHRLTGLLGVASTEQAVELLAALRDRVPSLVACELFFPEGMELVSAHRQVEPPFRIETGAYVLLECAGDEPPLDELAAGLEHAPRPTAEAFADDTAGRERLWLFREAHNEALNAAGVPHKFDVTVPLDRIARFEREVRRAVEPSRAVVYGHLGDGNLHVNVLGPPPEDTEIDALVLELVASHGGSISAEHGIGQSRRAFVPLGRSPADIAAMRAIKHALDPNGILNPGKLLPALVV